MRTTIDLPDSLLSRVKGLARRRRTTIRALVEEGLREMLRREATPSAYRLPDTVVHGDGPAPGVDVTDWAQMREAIYEGRGA